MLLPLMRTQKKRHCHANLRNQLVHEALDPVLVTGSPPSVRVIIPPSPPIRAILSGSLTGQHFTINRKLIADAIRFADIRRDDLVQDIGAGKISSRLMVSSTSLHVFPGVVSP